MRWSIFAVLFFVSVPTLAQGIGTVSGRVQDDLSEAYLPTVSITLISENGEAITGAVTDEDGRFILSGLETGDYTVRVEFVGYQDVEIPLLIGEKNDNYYLGTIEFSKLAGVLDEVVVTAHQEALTASLDRRVFRMEDNFAQSTGSLLDAMRGLPGVTVDQEGKVLLRGSDKVSILMDGRQTSLTGFGNQKGLDNVPAANIESIEIINNPSARYDAAGMAGVINIVYREERDAGLNADLGLTVGVGALSKRKDDLPTELGSYSRNPKIIPSLNMNYNPGNVNYYLQAEVMFQERLPNNEFTSRFYDDGTVILSQVPENRKQVQYIVKGGIDWTLSEQQDLSLSMILDRESHDDEAQVPYIDPVNDELRRFWFWNEEEVTGFFNIMLDHTYKFPEPGHELRTSLQYTRGWEDESYFLNEISPVRIGKDSTHLEAEENTVPFTLDYVRPLPSGRLETGIKLQKRWLPITYTVDRGEQSVIYPGLGDWSEWGEEIYAGYANLVYEKEFYDIEAGVRLEQTDVYYDLPEENIYYEQSDAYDYFKVYPNLRLAYKFDDNNRLAAFYNTRVDRPGEPELRIFPKYDDPELLKVGNPYLRPQFTDTIEIAYERFWDTGSLITSVYHKQIEDPFLRVFAIDDTNPNYDIVNKIYQNVGSGTNTGLELLATQDVGDWWKLSGSVNWYENVIDPYEVTLLFPTVRPLQINESKDKTWDLKLTNIFYLPSDFELQATFIYYAPRNIPQGRQFARSSLDLGLKKPVWDGKGEFVVTFSDVFNQFGIKQDIEGDGFVARYENYYETQVLSAGFKYKF